MPITKDEMINLLNKDLEWEFAAAIQYVQHAAVLTGPQYEGVIKELVLHSTEEMQHAVSLSVQIDYMGGTPTTKVEKIGTSRDSKTMLEQDLAGEQDAVRRYKERIKQAEEMSLYGLRRALEDILIMEEEHERDLKTALEL